MGESQGRWPEIPIIESPAGWLMKRLRSAGGRAETVERRRRDGGNAAGAQRRSRPQTEARRFFGILPPIVTSACLAKRNGHGRAGIAPTASPGSVAKNALVTAIGKSPKMANNNHISIIIAINGELYALCYSSLVTI
jgi:hypothetical protein